MKDMNALLLKGQNKELKSKSLRVFPWTICSYSHCTSNMRCYHGNQMVNKLQLYSSWKWLQTYWVSVGWGQRQRTWCHDNQGGRWGEMPWLNQERCQSPTECNQLVNPCLLLLLLLLFTVSWSSRVFAACNCEVRTSTGTYTLGKLPWR